MKHLFILTIALCAMIFCSCDKDDSIAEPDVEKPDVEDPKEPENPTKSLLALGKNCLILQSENKGLTWTKSNVPESYTTYNQHGTNYNLQLSDAIYANGKWIAVGGFGSGAVHAGLILSSDDEGKTWVKLDNPSTSKLYDIAYGDGQFVATGNKGNVITSTDGLDWKIPCCTNIFNLGKNKNAVLSHVAVGDGTIIVGGREEMMSEFGKLKNYLIMESKTKGKTWCRVNGLGGESITGLAYTDGQFMGVSSGSFISKTNGMWSRDNRSGKRKSSGLLNCFDKTFATVLKSSGSSRIAFTKEGQWVESNQDIYNLSATAIIRGNENYVLIGAEMAIPGNKRQAAIYTSEDGLTWTSSREWLTDQLVGNRCSFHSGVYSDGRYSIVGSQSRMPGTPPIFYSSEDGKEWIKSDMPVLTTEQQIYKIISN